MKSTLSIAWKNIIRRPLRSIAMLILAAVLSITMFGGTILSLSLQRGFASLEDRLGADIMVVPYEAVTRKSFENMVLQGNVGYFYMNGEFLDEISRLEGIGQISPQYYLASVKAGCCSLRVQIIGFDPETDFSITPWIRRSSGDGIGYKDVVVGNDLNAFVGDTLSFFGVDCHVAAKLDKTGTSYDTTVFTDRETIKTLIEASLNKQLNDYADINAGNVISCILINAADGYAVDDVVNDINIHFRKVRAIRTTQMISGISDSLTGVTKIASVLTMVIWCIALLVMAVAFTMMTGERKKEFAVMRVLGASRKKISALVLSEGAGLSLMGSLLGVFLGLVLTLSFSGYIETQMGLPFLLPGSGRMVLTAALSVLVSAAAGALSAALSAFRISRIDTGMILRSGE